MNAKHFHTIVKSKVQTVILGRVSSSTNIQKKLINEIAFGALSKPLRA